MGYGVLLLAAAYGLWTTQTGGGEFSRWLYIGAIPLGLLFIFPVFPGQAMSVSNTIFQLLGIAVDVVIVMYLGTTAIERIFEPKGPSGSFEEYVRSEPQFSDHGKSQR